MQPKIKFSLIANMAVLLALLSSGIGLFFMRTNKVPRLPDLELQIRANEGTQTIVSGQYLILLHKNLGIDLEKILDPLGLEPILPLLNWTLVAKKHNSHLKTLSLNSAQADEDRLMLTSLLQHPNILDAQHNFVLEAAAMPTNKEFDKAWGLQSRSEEPRSLNMPKAWELTEGSAKVKVAVIDDFIYKNSFSFASRFEKCLSRITFLEPFGRMDQSLSSIPHGELMLLALGACNNQAQFSAGMDSQASLLAIERSSTGHAQTMAAALFAGGINICEQSLVPCPKGLSLSPPTKADIILLPFANNAPDLLQFFSDMLDALRQENVIVVAAAGNNKARASNFFPGRAPGLINVGALNQEGQRAHFSNWGPSVDLMAPGDDIHLIYPSLSKTVAGTSLSAAFVAGSISLMKAVNPSITWKGARYFLGHAASVLPCEDYCLNETSSDEKIGCATLCCDSTENRCGALAVDTAQALELARKQDINASLLELDKSYLIFTRNSGDVQSIVIKNSGDQAAEVNSQIYDDNIIVNPPRFSLSARNDATSQQAIAISFKKEPFKRQTIKVEFIVRKNNSIEDRAELLIEYIPKSSFGEKT